MSQRTSGEDIAPNSQVSDESESVPGMTAIVVAIVFQQIVASLCYPIAKVGLAIIEPFTFAFFRYLLASAALLTIVKFKKYNRPIEKRDIPRILLLGFLIIPLNQTLFLLGQSKTAAGHGAFLFSTIPIWIFLLAMIHLKERAPVTRALGIVLALSGVVVIMWNGFVTLGTQYLLGDAIILISVLAWAYYTIIGKGMVRKYGALRMTAYALSSGAAMYFPFGLVRALQFDYSKAEPIAWFSIAYMAIGLSVVVYLIWYWLLKYLEASRIAVYQNIQPIIASIVAYFFLAEPLGLGFIVGGSIVICGVVLSEIPPHKFTFRPWS